MASMTKAQLVAQYSALLQQYEAQGVALRDALARAQPVAQRLSHQAPALVRTSKPARQIFEFDASIDGDFKRAALAAKAAGGSVQRART